MTAAFPFSVASPELCHNLLHHSEGEQHIGDRFITTYIFKLR
jgi:hypothetical protein